MEWKAARGLELPAVGLGTMRLRGRACRDLVSAALAEGYRHLDTARKYGNEEEVGAAVRRSSVSRDDIVLTTKVSHEDLAPPDLRKAVESSLERLGVDHVDLLLVHWPSREVPLDDTMSTLADLREEGRTRFIGVANFPSRLLEAVAGTPGLVGDQVEYHPYLAQEPVLEAVRSRGLLLTAYCPLGRGGPLLRDPLLVEIATGHGVAVAQIVLRWLVAQEQVVAIPGTSRLDHLRQNLDVFSFALTGEERAAIAGLARADRICDPPHAPDWDPEGGGRAAAGGERPPRGAP